MRHLSALLLSALLAAPAFAQQSPDALARTRAMEARVHVLQQAPGVKEYFDLERRLQKIKSDNEARIFEQVSKLEEELSTLRNTPAFETYLKSLEELNGEFREARPKDKQDLIDAAKKLYSERHAELVRPSHPPIPGGKALGFDVLTFPRLDGSTSAQPLEALIACRLLDVPYQWEYPEPTGGIFFPHRRIDSVPQLSGEYLWIDELNIAASRASAVAGVGGGEPLRRKAAVINSLIARCSSTHEAYVNLINGECDLNFTARAPSADEIALARKNGVTLDLAPIARDAFVFIVHRDNPVKTLTLDQLRQIYSLKIRDWKSIPGGPPAGEILPFMRERNSGSRELFDALVMNGLPVPSEERFPSLFSQTMGGPYSALTEKPLGIGYSVYYYEHFMALSPYTRPLAIDGSEPTADTIASGKYPLTTPVYVAYRKSEPENSPARRLLAWLLSPEGQAVVREAGYIPAK
jgi:phosphate transport system substrate-binding protein